MVNGSLYEIGITCACWCSYHPRSPFFAAGVSMAALMVVFGALMVARPAWGKWSAMGLWGVSLVSLPLGDQFWLGAGLAALAAFVWYRKSVSPPKKGVYLAIIGVPLVVAVGIVAYVITRPGGFLALSP